MDIDIHVSVVVANKLDVSPDQTLNLRISLSANYCNYGSPNLNSSKSSPHSCTIVIVFLASLSLILLTGLSLALIVLRKKKPFAFLASCDKGRIAADQNISADNESPTSTAARLR